MRFELVRLPILTAAVATAATSGAQIYGISYDTGEIFEVNPTTAALSDLDNTGPIANIGDLVLANNGLVYGFTTGSNAMLYSFNPNNDWSSTLIGALGAGFFYEGALANYRGTIYGANAGSVQNDHIFTLNLQTGAATIGAQFNRGGGLIDFNAFDVNANGTLVGIDRVSNSLESINPGTGAVATLGPLIDTGSGAQVTLGEVGGMTTYNGTSYFNTSGPGGVLPGNNSFYTVDETDGDSTLIGAFNAPLLGPHGISGLVALNSAPEPGSLLALTGLVSVMGLARRRRIARTSHREGWR